jgi:large subunit ribosomal protein L35
MPSVKMKTHKGVKKRFKVSAKGKVSHKRCGSSHLNSHKSGKKIRRLRKKSVVKIGAEAQRLRRVLRKHEVLTQPKPEGTETAEPGA